MPWYVLRTSNMDRVASCIGQIEHPHSWSEVNIRGLSYPIRAKRKAIFLGLRQDIIEGRQPAVDLEQHADIYTAAEHCAQTILANECPLYIAAVRYEGVVRVVPRDKYPHWYRQVVQQGN